MVTEKIHRPMVTSTDVTTRETCTATAHATGQRCRRAPVAGATVCQVHGGKAPQVQRAAARRALAGLLSLDGHDLPDAVNLRHELLRAAWAHRRLAERFAALLGDLTTETTESTDQTADLGAPTAAMLREWRTTIRDYTRLLEAIHRADVDTTGTSATTVETLFSPAFAAELTVLVDALEPWPDARRAAGAALLQLQAAREAGDPA